MTPPDKPKKEKAGKFCETCPKKFIIILGGPGVYDPRDPAHDRAWYSYYYTLANGFDSGKIKLEDGETVDWLVYTPAYNERWTDDNKDNKRPKFISDQVKRIITHFKAKNYLDRIKKWIAGNSTKHRYIGIKTKNSIVSHINSMKADSVTRLYYSGHSAKRNELWLDLDHIDPGIPIRPRNKNAVFDADEFKKVKKSVIRTTSKLKSRFIGCNNEIVAQEWNKATGLKSVGYPVTINFKDYHDFPNGTDQYKKAEFP